MYVEEPPPQRGPRRVQIATLTRSSCESRSRLQGAISREELHEGYSSYSALRGILAASPTKLLELE